MINLFEYKNTAPFPENHFENLEVFLDEVWAKREKSNYYTEDENREEVQRFIQFLHKSKTLKSNKYVGVIHFEGETLNLLPKIFFTGSAPQPKHVKAISTHILWWLSYCRKIKFPNYLSGLSSTQSDFFEILIYLFSKYTRELLNSSIYQKYIEVNRELSFVKGRINFNSYIAANLATARHHKVSCTYDSFEMDNEFNRCVKFVSKLLLGVSQDYQNKRFLNDIIFILDDVKDIRVSADKMKRMSFNPMFSNFETIRDYCVLFLDNSVSFNYKSSMKLFAFLLPMEYVFEDFVFGFIDKEIDEIKAKSQLGNTYLDEETNFKLKPDLYLSFLDKKVIADTKYKIVYSDSTDPKKGISQNDLYQMLAYAVRFGVSEIVLYYPNTLNHENPESSELSMVDSLAENQKIHVRSFQLPIINFDLFKDDYISKTSLILDFEETRVRLIGEIRKSLRAD
ncbi:McrC family protein [Pseudotamlana agarivorans]|uniref:McrC family protein n=1 Tax=Pseudotamlana agarivorans TaxID=481183 RepID=UPI000834A46D|nr:hypothetical protein [Tamlana agarivorans]